MGGPQWVSGCSVSGLGGGTPGPARRLAFVVFDTDVEEEDYVVVEVEMEGCRV
jgi:hypothetical protein